MRLVDSAVEVVRERGAAAVSFLLATTFSALMLPAWVATLSSADAQRQTPSWFVGIAYAVACVLAVPLTRGKSRTAQGVVCLIVLAMGLALVGLTSVENSAILVCALGIVAALLPPAVTTVVTAVTVGSVLWSAWYADRLEGQVQNIVILISVTTATVLTVGLANAYTALKAARDQVAALAVAKERERFARDLHDILGHSLTTITVKAGLTRRMLETGHLEWSVAELRDLERLGRQALADMRATVSEYREITLSGELAAAGETLRAADIRADLSSAVDNVEPALQQLFGYVLREAITNVIRHSRARSVSVRLDRNSITITDDGVGTANAPGHGLSGLSERMREAGGVLRTETGPRGGFTVRASFPSREDSQ